jgi:hypothetical protein
MVLQATYSGYESLFSRVAGGFANIRAFWACRRSCGCASDARGDKKWRNAC